MKGLWVLIAVSLALIIGLVFTAPIHSIGSDVPEEISVEAVL